MQGTTSLPPSLLQLIGVLLQAEVEGSPDVQLTLSSEETELRDIVYHPIVHADDAHHRGNQRKVRFCAPLESQSLLHYTVTTHTLPIRGFYQMKVVDGVYSTIVTNV